MSKRTSIVFAHGLWADGSCFSKLIPTLQAEGHEVMASQHGLDSLRATWTCVNAAWPGHEPGGPRRPLLRRHADHHAGTERPRRRPGLYRGARARRRPRPRRASRQKFPVTDVFSHIDVADGRIWLSPSGVGRFAGDLPEAEQKLV